MNSTFYDLATGLFTAQWYTGGHIEAALPAGCGHVEGIYDHLSQRVDLATGEVVDYQPPSPGDTDLATWAWDKDRKRWIGSKTDAAIALDVRAVRDQLLAACDWRVFRALEAQAPISDDWKAYRQALRDLPEQAGFPADVALPNAPVEAPLVPVTKTP